MYKVKEAEAIERDIFLSHVSQIQLILLCVDCEIGYNAEETNIEYICIL